MYASHTHNYKSGFIALISTVIISFVILTLVIAVSFSGFFGRFSILGSEVNERSSSLAEACVETAALTLSQGKTYATGKYILVGDGGCYICPVSGTDVSVQASSSNAYTNIQVDIDSDGVISDWKEIPVIDIDWGNDTCDIP